MLWQIATRLIDRRYPQRSACRNRSGRSLPKTGKFTAAAGAFNELASHFPGLGAWRPTPESRESTPWQAFSERPALRSAWLGRKDSNLEMANWKSDALAVREEPQNPFSLNS
jgi:hypothetical protein